MSDTVEITTLPNGLRVVSESMPRLQTASLGVWEQFLDVRAGKMENTCPPQVGLRMAKLWDAINASAQQGGKPVDVK